MTRSKDFPSDILALARQTQDAAIKACADEKLAVSDYPFASGHAKEVLDEHIARALLLYGQRRADEATEQAARVADSFIVHGEEQIDALRRITAVDIARAIRSSK